MEDIVVCPFCKEDIKAGAIRCKHCGSTLLGPSDNNNDMVSVVPKGTLQIPLWSLILSIMSLFAFPEDLSAWGRYNIIGMLVFAVSGFTLAVITIYTQTRGRGIAITGIALSSLALLAGGSAAMEWLES